MAHYAKVVNGTVEDVIVADADFIASLEDSELWIQTSYNSHGGKRYSPETGLPISSEHLRFNFASIGMNYDYSSDAFYDQKPYQSWVLNKSTFQWVAPVAMPDNSGVFEWNEDRLSWDEVSSSGE